jgi:hypothetical protein
MLARADRSGLGNQTYEFWRHMQPDQTLVVDMGCAARGEQDFSRYPDCPVTAYDPTPGVYAIQDRGALRQLCANVDVVYTAEVPYSPELLDIAGETGTRVVVHANPELLADDMLGADIWLPTDWQRDLVEQRAGRRVRVVPVPTPTRPEPEPWSDAPRFVHVGAPAMLDRNGSELVAEALQLMRAHTSWDVFGSDRPGGETIRIGNADVTFHTSTLDYWSLYASAQVLVLPRRYGGLSLPMQEAAAAGLAVVSLDLEPQRGWLHPCGLVPARGAHWAMMKGGQFMVHDCDPERLATHLDSLATDPPLVDIMRDHAREWAASLAWEDWAPRYREYLANP